MTEPPEETYSEAETEARREQALRNMLATPPKPHAALKKRRERSEERPLSPSPKQES